MSEEEDALLLSSVSLEGPASWCCCCCGCCWSTELLLISSMMVSAAFLPYAFIARRLSAL
ncbi:hypothetical protein BCR43DRAFT_491026 [Syncephalastrum racemosum]|uniref:Uncharacterized protein n=1 Tax=Syncephalastrum racemosum TaxID=13706 RepID=A0A1X2HH06_SYNRA|nr:hypothetical protein BCR43DRAFT_491026 [Syncephalastrum racemosum]